MGTLNFVVFLGCTALVAYLSYLWTRGTDEHHSDGYFLGGRSLTAPVIAGSLLLTNLSTEQIVGLTGQAYAEGILVMAWETLAAIAIVVTALVLLPRYLRSGISTIPAFLEERYDAQTKTITSLLFLSGYVIVLLPIVLYSGALALSTMFDVPAVLGVSDRAALWITVWAIGIVGSIYAIFGGLKAVAVSDTINAVGLFVGGLLVPVFGLMAIGGGSLTRGLSVLWAENPEKFDAVGGPDSSIPIATIFTGMMLVQLFYWGTNQAIIQRALGAKDLKEGQKGLILAGFLKIFGPVIVVLPGIIAWHLFDGGLDVADQAYPRLVTEVLPFPLRGFFAAVLFGAILSSFNSALNSSVTLFGVDIYRQYFNTGASDSQVVTAGKRFGIVLAIASMTIAPFIANAPQGLFGYLQEVNGCYSIPILTIILVGIFTRRVPPIAAKIGLASGVGLYIISQFVLKPAVGAENYPHFLHVMAVLFVLNVCIMLLIGKLRPMEPAYAPRDSHAVDMTPWPMARPLGFVIVAVVVSTYFIFT
ncbi:solute:sodium symporter family transporter [Paracoccus fistulariae]|uniref:Solute:sodium symporter family transporter n=1 Tax=Paracoccus fistulariae TaxID=658446 RepID=A0ABY7SMM3_9RHOB|nr:solute:sodium symporter family transporter [Paracoccus fistulariae]MDB6180165.1 solute:sodium symporter family transporter [Paracoccus fistulariae]WCR08250.1 solute:sodium symporter family transporter [Paracoccus fistulariae]